MTEDYLKRIDAALARIEAIPLAPCPAVSDAVAVQELRGRHDALRNQAKAAIAEIDALIGASR